MLEQQKQCEGIEANDQRAAIIRVVRTHGPLFVCEDPSVFLQTLPQAQKKHHSGAPLSIEELEYLSHTHTIEFLSEDDARCREYLRERHTLSCRVYRHLTDVEGLRLRHGSQFGAAFIGYRDVESHGDCLVFFGPLAHLATVAAVRVACSVAKEAWVVEELPSSGGSGGESSTNGFSVTKLDKCRGGD
ncbi:hypothetical protein DQ04_02381100 [Trypanosoma grayi]|uniref:hypothetical protein n=1 Tax=Trypanosoma grayi TaxID=71804 RepID=UPI0004F451A2|nr:hypothetical protein DQ04_02381100 [Trypanosoma grayi]KEG11675.1 hypothetical protein DQ04_02381100 [Trypanosoma grayi]